MSVQPTGGQPTPETVVEAMRESIGQTDFDVAVAATWKESEKNFRRVVRGGWDDLSEQLFWTTFLAGWVAAQRSELYARRDAAEAARENDHG